MSVWDEMDYAILRALQEEAGLSSATLARRLGLSQPATWRRVKRLEEAGVIAGRELELDPAKLGFGDRHRCRADCAYGRFQN